MHLLPPPPSSNSHRPPCATYTSLLWLQSRLREEVSTHPFLQKLSCSMLSQCMLLHTCAMWTKVLGHHTGRDHMKLNSFRSSGKSLYGHFGEVWWGWDQVCDKLQPLWFEFCILLHFDVELNSMKCSVLLKILKNYSERTISSPSPTLDGMIDGFRGMSQ